MVRLSQVFASCLVGLRRSLASITTRLRLRWVQVCKPLQAAFAVCPVGRELVAALVAQQRHGGPKVETRQRQHGAQQHPYFGHAQT